MKAVVLIAVFLWSAGAAFTPALACGVCVDDKVASAYDHAVVQSAWKQGKVVVFCELSGPDTVEGLTHLAKKAAHGLRGVDPASIRSGRDLPVVSFALDTAHQNPTAAVQALQQRLQSKAVTPTLLKVLQKKPAKS